MDDSPRYIEYANGLASGFYFDSHNFWYIGYSLFLLLMFKLFGGSITAVVVGQYVLSFLSVIALYRSSVILGSSRVSAVITCLLFLAFADISLWNSYILTESMYTSFTCFSFYFLILIYKGKRTPLIIATTVVFIAFTFFIKPTGIALIVAVFAVLLCNFLRTNKSIVVRVGILLIAFGLLMMLVNRMITTYLILENYQLGEIIYGVRSYTGSYPVEALMMDPPADLYIPASEIPIIKIVSFVLHNPLYWTKLFALKIYYLLSHTRPFWSTTHNLFSLIILLPCYGLFSKFIRDQKKETNVIVFAITFVLIHILSVGITSEDWDGRFLLPILPVIFLAAGHEVTKLFSTPSHEPNVTG